MFRTFVRHCSEAAIKAEVKISWNKDNKQLFGQVVKVKKGKKSTKLKNESAKDEKPEAVLGSEMHWMLGSAHNRRRMLARPYDNTERVALKVNHPKDEVQEKKSSGFDEILKVPLIYDERDSFELRTIPEIVSREVPSVGKILQATMSDGARNALIQWKLSKIEELGEEGFQKLQKDNLSRGLRFHNLLQNYFMGLSDNEHLTEESGPDYKVWKSVQTVLPEIERQAMFVEQRLVHPVLQYKGVVDCVSSVG